MGFKNGLFKVLSVGLVLATGSQGVVWAEPGAAAVVGTSTAAKAVGPVVHFSLPASVGVIDDTWFSGNDGRMVVLIQDAHTNESGQMNAARALERILPAENIKTLYIEGGEAGRDVTPDALKAGSLPDRERVGGEFVRKGLLNGAEYLSMTSDRDFRIVGTEDPELYAEAGELYRRAVDGRSAALRWVDRLSRAIDALKPDLWSAELRQLGADRELYRTGQLALTDYFARLSEAGLKHGVDLRAYPNLKDLMLLQTREIGIDLKRVGDEELLALKELPEPVRAELAGLRAPYSPFKRSAAQRYEQGPDGFFAALQAALTAQDPAADARFPSLFAYFSYVNDTRRFNAPGSLRELADYEKAVWDSMVTGPGSGNLELFWEVAGRMRRIAALEASPEDFESYLRDPIRHDPDHAAAWVNRRITDLNKHFDHAVAVDSAFEAPFMAAVNFYRVNALRDRVIAASVIRSMDTAGEKRAVLVTGGFHTPNLKRLLKARGISYVSVVPQVRHETDKVRYERLVRETLDEMRQGNTGPHLVASTNGTALTPTAGSGGSWMLRPVASRLAVVQQILSAMDVSGEAGRTVVPAVSIVLKKPDTDLFDGVRTVIPAPPAPAGSGEGPEPSRWFGARMALSAPVDQPAILNTINGFYEKFRPVPIADEVPTAPEYELVADLGPAASVTAQTLFGDPDPRHDGELASRFDLLNGHILAARAVYGWMNDLGPKGVFAKERSDAAATAALRRGLERLPDNISVKSEVSEGERDFEGAAGAQEHHAMISIGEVIPGRRPSAPSDGPARQYSAAFDVLEVTNAVSQESFLGAASVGTYTTRDTLRGFPDYYLHKWAVGPAAATADLSFDVSTAENIRRIAAASGKNVSDLRGSVLFRPAHIRLIIELIKAGINAGTSPHIAELIKQFEAYETLPTPQNRGALKSAFNQIKARLKATGYLRLGNLTLLADGDLLPAVALGLPDDADGHLDFLVGRGGSSEGVMAASAVKAIGGKIIATLVSHDKLNEDAFDADLVRDGKNFSPVELARLAEEFNLLPAAQSAAGQENLNTVYTASDLIRTDDFVFVATAVKAHALIPGLARPVLSDDGQTFTTTSLWVSSGSIRLITVTQKTLIADLKTKTKELKTRIKNALGSAERSKVKSLQGELASAYHDLGRTYLFFQRFGEAQYYLGRSLELNLRLGIPSNGSQNAAIDDAIVSERAALLHAAAIQVLQTGAYDDGLQIVSPADAALDLLESAIDLRPTLIDARLRTQQIHAQIAEYLGDEAADRAEEAPTDFEKLTALEEAQKYYGRAAGRETLAVSPGRLKFQTLLEPIRQLRERLGGAGARMAFADTASARSTVDDFVLGVALQNVGLTGSRFFLEGGGRNREVRFLSQTPGAVRVRSAGRTRTISVVELRQTRQRRRVDERGAAQKPREALSSIGIMDADRKQAVDAIAGFGWIDAYFRIPVGFIFPETVTDPKAGAVKKNLNNDQIRAGISLLLLDLAAFTGERENGRRITFYLDPENLNPDNRAWLNNAIALMPDLRVLSDTDPLPKDRTVFNWYVGEGHKDWRTDADATRRVTKGPNLRLAPTRPRIAQRWSLAVRTSVEAFFAVLPAASTSRTSTIADQYVRATSFASGAKIWQDRGRWFHAGAVFKDPADLFAKFQGSQLFLPQQVASYILFKDIGQWADFVQQMRRRTAISV